MRALIMDQGLDRGSLAAVRALRDDGWTVGVGSPVRGLAGSSRAVSRWHEVPAAERGVREYLEAVRTAVDEGDYDVVFSSDDIGVIALSRHRDGLGAVVPYAGHDTVVRSLDKLGMTRAAEAVGLAVPRTAQATDDVVERLDAPTIVKPRLHSVLRPGAPGRLETVLARSPEEARDAVAEIREAGVEPILQEVVQGDLMSFQAVIDRDGTDARAGPAALPAHLAARLRVGGPRPHGRDRPGARRAGGGVLPAASGGSGWRSSSSSRPTTAASRG